MITSAERRTEWEHVVIAPDAADDTDFCEARRSDWRCPKLAERAVIVQAGSSW